MNMLERAKKEEFRCPDCGYGQFRKITLSEEEKERHIMLQCEQCDYVVAHYKERTGG